jgi:hypothetical protein
MYVQRNTVTCSHDHYFSGNTNKQSVCVVQLHITGNYSILLYYIILLLYYIFILCRYFMLYNIALMSNLCRG